MIDNVGALTGAAFGTGGPRAPSSKMGKDEFLKLLVAQMSNQDPLNPMEGQEFAAQLAQFSSVEQLIQLNTKLDAQAAAQASMAEAVSGSVAMSAFGRTVTAVGSQVEVQGRESTVSFHAAGSGTATLRILDASGRVVGTQALGAISAGNQTVRLGDAAQGLKPGVYSYQVEVKGADGSDVSVQSFMTGRVDGIRYTSDGPVLTSGGMTIPFGSILQIVTES